MNDFQIKFLFATRVIRFFLFFFHFLRPSTVFFEKRKDGKALGEQKNQKLNQKSLVMRNEKHYSWCYQLTRLKFIIISLYSCCIKKFNLISAIIINKPALTSPFRRAAVFRPTQCYKIFLIGVVIKSYLVLWKESGSKFL